VEDPTDPCHGHEVDVVSVLGPSSKNTHTELKPAWWLANQQFISFLRVRPAVNGCLRRYTLVLFGEHTLPPAGAACSDSKRKGIQYAGELCMPTWHLGEDMDRKDLEDQEMLPYALSVYLQQDSSAANFVLAIEPDMVMVKPIPPWGIEHRRPVGYPCSYLGKIGQGGQFDDPLIERPLRDVLLQLIRELPSKETLPQSLQELVSASGDEDSGKLVRFESVYSVPSLSRKEDLIRAGAFYPRALALLKARIHEDVEAAATRMSGWLSCMYAWPIAAAAAGIQYQQRRGSLMFQMEAPLPEGVFTEFRMLSEKDGGMADWSTRLDPVLAVEQRHNFLDKELPSIIHLAADFGWWDGHSNFTWHFSKQQYNGVDPLDALPAAAPSEFRFLAEHITLSSQFLRQTDAKATV